MLEGPVLEGPSLDKSWLATALDDPAKPLRAAFPEDGPVPKELCPPPVEDEASPFGAFEPLAVPPKADVPRALLAETTGLTLAEPVVPVLWLCKPSRELLISTLCDDVLPELAWTIEIVPVEITFLALLGTALLGTPFKDDSRAEPAPVMREVT